MRVGYHESILNSDEIVEVPNGQHRLLYQMGGSRSPGHYHKKEHMKFCMEEHHLQVRHT